MRRPDAYKVFLFIEFTSALLYSMAFTVMSLYEATVAGLNPLQLVLVGTTLEVAVLLFEVPTGVVADVFSRRASVIVGFVIVGLAFLVEGLFPVFLPILGAQLLYGLGYTFTSGALQAWISDEIGEQDANRAFLRANRLALAGALTGMAIAFFAGSLVQVNLPLLLSGGGRIVLAVVLIGLMTERGFRPTPVEKRQTFRHMAQTFKDGIAAVRARPRLNTILGIGLIYGLYSEGFDRLWVKHLLDRFDLPVWFGGNEVAFFAVLRMTGLVLSMLATRALERRMDASRPEQIGRAMLGVTAGIALALGGFALSPVLGLSMALYWGIAALRNLGEPLYTAWVNQRLEARTRATVLSLSSQVDAVGQIAGGPAVGWLARAVSVPLALGVSAALLAPALGLVARANREGELSGADGRPELERNPE